MISKNHVDRGEDIAMLLCDPVRLGPPDLVEQPDISLNGRPKLPPNTLKRSASWRLGELYRLADFRNAHRVPLDTSSWIFALAATLSCGRPGIIHIERLWFSMWQGLDAGSLESACRQCGIVGITPDERTVAINRVEAWVRENGPKMFKADTIGQLLQVTAEERIFAKIKTIGAIDENLAARKQRRKSDDMERKQAKRRALGMMPRSEYLASSLSKTKPWETAGMSRATWFRLGKPVAESAGVAATDMSLTSRSTSRQAA